MTVSRRNTALSSAPENDRKIYSDLAKVDAHVIQPHEYEDAPELTDEQLANGWLEIGGVPVRRGRPKAAATKQAVNLRLSPDVLAFYRGTGPGWQTRIDAALRKAAGLK